MEDFEEIARALAKPLNEFGTAQGLLLSVWSAALAYVAAAAAERLEFITLGMVHFVPGLNADSADTVLAQLETESVGTVRPLPAPEAAMHWRAAACSGNVHSALTPCAARFACRRLQRYDAVYNRWCA